MYESVREWLLPAGSKRRRFAALLKWHSRRGVELTCRSFKLLRDDGPVVLSRKMGRKVGAAWRTVTLRRAESGRTSNRYDIIIFAPIDWRFRHQRPQQIARAFAAEGHRVFYVSVHLKKRASYRARPVEDRVVELMLPFTCNATIYTADLMDGRAILAGALDSFFRDFRIEEAVALVGFPLWYSAAAYLKEAHGAIVIFDCLDEFAGFTGVSAGIEDIERKLLQTCDFCITTSLKLYEKLRDKTDRLALVRNATEFSHFHDLHPGNVLKNVGKPIIGYYGAIAEWFDAETVEYIAARRPGWHIVLIGHTFGADIAGLRKYDNIHFLGERPYEELPKFLFRFDACIIPFRVNELTLSTNPVKFYEFISSGKPVVASRLPELEFYSDYLYLSDGKEEFLENVERALREDDASLRGKRIELAKANDWAARVNDIRQCIKAASPLVSIIIVTFNNRSYTERCIESIYAKTAYPNFELVIVDNASSDGTKEYLDGLARSRGNIIVIYNRENLGFAAANNIGIGRAKGEYVIFLNNDTIVTGGWISGLTKHLRDPRVGLIGPVTNSIGNEAKINTRYKNLEEMDGFAHRYTSQRRGMTFEIPVLALFCAAARRETVDRVGLLEERFSVGMFEDDDYSVRVKKAGLKVLCAEDVFIHHYGGASFGKLPSEEYRKIFEENRKRFEEKWGMKWQPHKYRNGVI
jgi:GT2 family glycosyltransferase